MAPKSKLHYRCPLCHYDTDPRDLPDGERHADTCPMPHIKVVDAKVDGALTMFAALDRRLRHLEGEERVLVDSPPDPHPGLTRVLSLATTSELLDELKARVVIGSD